MASDIHVKINVKSKAMLRVWSWCIRLGMPERFTRFLASLAVEYEVGDC